MFGFRTILCLAGAIATGASAAAPAPASRVAGSISDDDYPQAAAANGEYGVVLARFVVAPDGRVRECAATSETYAPTLRLWTCFLLTERFRYVPAHDERGKAVAETKSQRVTWLLPGRAVNPASAASPLRPFRKATELTVAGDGRISDCITTGSGPDEIAGPDLCEKLQSVVPFKDVAGRPVAGKVIVTTTLEVESGL